MKTQTLKSTINGQFSLHIGSLTRKDEFESLAYLPIFSFDYLSISLKEWNQQIVNFFSNTKIDKIEKVEFTEMNDNYNHIYLCFEAVFNKTQLISKDIELLGIKVNNEEFNKFFDGFKNDFATNSSISKPSNIQLVIRYILEFNNSIVYNEHNEFNLLSN